MDVRKATGGLIGPGRILDEVLDEIEQLTRAQEACHLVVVTVAPEDDAAAIEAKRVAAVERLAVHPMSVDLTVYVMRQGTP